MQVLTNTTKNWVKTPIVLWTIIATLFMMTGVYVAFQASDARAAAMTSVSDTISDSAPETTTIPSHTFAFTTPTAYTTDSTATADVEVWLYFPQTTGEFDINALTTADFTPTLDSGTCSSQALAVTAVNLSDGGGDAGNDTIEVELNETGQDSVSIPANCQWTLIIDASPGIGNPPKDAAVGTADTWQIGIGTRQLSGGSDVDAGTAMVAIIEGVTVSATIAETLSFSINNVGTGAGNCETADDANVDTFVDISAQADNTVPFGNLSSSNNFYAACQDLSVSTNASGGYTLTAQSNISLKNAAADVIDSGNCDGSCTQSTGGAWTTNTNNGFAFFCNDEGASTDCDDAGDTASEYRNFACTGADADCNPRTGGESAVAVMVNTTSVNANVGRIYYKLSVGGIQPAGTYSNTVTYIATPTF